VDGNRNSRSDAGKTRKQKEAGNRQMDRMVNKGNVKICTKISYSGN
jgi:hypothetical protein